MYSTKAEKITRRIIADKLANIPDNDFLLMILRLCLSFEYQNRNKGAEEK